MRGRLEQSSRAHGTQFRFHVASLAYVADVRASMLEMELEPGRA